MVKIDFLSEWESGSLSHPQEIQYTRGIAIFLLAVLISIISLGIFLWTYTLEVETLRQYRQVAYILAAFALPLALGSVVISLPTNNRALILIGIAFILIIIAIVIFVSAYPAEWNTTSGTDYSFHSISVYAVGILLLCFLVVASLSLYVVERFGLLLLPEEVRKNNDITREMVREHVKEIVEEETDSGKSSWQKMK